MKKIVSILMTAAALTAMVSCSDKALDETNKDVNHAPDADAKFVFADVCLSSAFNVTGGDFNTYAGVAVEHWGGCHNQLFNADQRTGEWISSSCFNNGWVSLYKTIVDARTVIAKCDENSGTVDAGKEALGACAKVLLAYNAAVLTDLFGDAPYTQAGNYNLYPNPALDKQEDIYKDIFKMLDEAIVVLTAGGNNGAGSYDLLYSGSCSQWLKFAYGLRARLKMHTILRSQDQAADYAQIISDADKSFADASEQAEFGKYDGDSQCNPLFSFWYSREAIAASESIHNKYENLGDPRDTAIFCVSGAAVHITPSSPYFEAVPNGAGIEAQEWYTDDMYFYCLSAPTTLLSYAEVQYLKAEALARTGADASDALENALYATFDNVNANAGYASGWGFDGEGVSDDDIDTYVAARLAVPAADQLKEVMVQKYLYFHNANGGSVEAYNDIRRLMAEGGAAAAFITLENPKNATKGFPLRFGYGSSDTTTNPNVKAAFGDGSYVFTENVWWAGGTR